MLEFPVHWLYAQDPREEGYGNVYHLFSLALSAIHQVFEPKDFGAVL